MAKRRPSRINCLLAVDKPLGITSHDAVSRARKALGERRVGHAGTLDPAASGVLLLGVGQATRLLGMLTLDRKGYVARISFGAQTDTDDAEGRVTDEAPVPPELADPARARELLAGFTGPQKQVPPSYSAISVGGVRSYARARGGEEFELPARDVEVFSAELIGIESAAEKADGDAAAPAGAPEPGAGGPGSAKGDGAVPGPAPVSWTVSFEVSKGTYIRALARDIGIAAGTRAHLSGLRRTSAGLVRLADCLPLDGLAGFSPEEGALDPVRALGVPAAELSEEQLEDVRCGRALSARAVEVPDGVSEGSDIALVRQGRLHAVARWGGRGVRSRAVFPDGIEGVAWG